MKKNNSLLEFYKTLKSKLPTSNTAERKIWAGMIIDQNIELIHLADLMLCEYKIASRFLWMMSDLGEINASKLHFELPILLDFCERENSVYITAFASYWYIVGVPIENEARAIELLFQWLVSHDTNVSIKSRSLIALFNLTKKYPDLKNELAICINDQIEKQAISFQKRAKRILREMEGNQGINQT
jgi:hypothetical protein